MSYREILNEATEGTGYEIRFQLSGEIKPETGLSKAHPYNWQLALQTSKDFPRVKQAVVRTYLPSESVGVLEYQPKTAERTKVAEISANLLPQLTVTIPVFSSPPVVASQQMDGDKHLVEWQFKKLSPDRKFRCLLKGVVIVNFYEKKYQVGFPLKVYAMADFTKSGRFARRHESLTISRESDRIKPVKKARAK